MKLDEAIEINKYLVELSLLHQCQDHAAAIKLGNEALKAWRKHQAGWVGVYKPALPGETKE